MYYKEMHYAQKHVIIAGYRYQRKDYLHWYFKKNKTYLLFLPGN